jgi:hypothetical protein
MHFYLDFQLLFGGFFASSVCQAIEEQELRMPQYESI